MKRACSKLRLFQRNCSSRIDAPCYYNEGVKICKSSVLSKLFIENIVTKFSDNFSRIFWGLMIFINETFIFNKNMNNKGEVIFVDIFLKS